MTNEKVAIQLFGECVRIIDRYVHSIGSAQVYTYPVFKQIERDVVAECLVILVGGSFPRLLHHQYVLHQSHEYEDKRAEEEVVDGFQIRHPRHVDVHGAAHVADGQHRGDAEGDPGRNGFVVDPEAHPGQRHQAATRDVHLEDVVHGAAVENHGGCQTREHCWRSERERGMSRRRSEVVVSRDAAKA